MTSALRAIASMKTAEDTDYAQLCALCTAIAAVELDRLGAAVADIHPVEREALEIIACRRQCLDNLMAHRDVAREALRLMADE